MNNNIVTQYCCTIYTIQTPMHNKHTWEGVFLWCLYKDCMQMTVSQKKSNGLDTEINTFKIQH